jgi:hypothetical protein
MVHMRDLIARCRVLLFLSVFTGLFIPGAASKIEVWSTQRADAQSPASASANPLLAKWSGPYGGVPPFDRVQIAYFKPALETAMAESLS